MTTTTKTTTQANRTNREALDALDEMVTATRWYLAQHPSCVRPLAESERRGMAAWLDHVMALAVPERDRPPRLRLVSPASRFRTHARGATTRAGQGPR